MYLKYTYHLIKLLKVLCDVINFFLNYLWAVVYLQFDILCDDYLHN